MASSSLGQSREASGVKTQKERAEEKRRQKLEEMQAQIRDGSLVVRKLTPAEREKHAPRPPREKKAR
jgi:hypothetical protein